MNESTIAKIKQRVIPIRLSLLVVIVFLLHATGLLPLPLLDTLENHAYDAMVSLRQLAGGDDRLAIVEIHASLLTALLDDRIMERPASPALTECTLLAVFGLLLVCTLPFLSPLGASATALGLALAYTAVNLTAWQVGNLVLPLASGLGMISIVFLLFMAHGFFLSRLSTAPSHAHHPLPHSNR